MELQKFEGPIGILGGLLTFIVGVRLSPKSYKPEKPLSGESVKEWKVKE